MQNVIPILFTTNMEGIEIMKVSIFSLLFNAKPNTFYEIFIFHSDISISIQDELIKYLIGVGFQA